MTNSKRDNADLDSSSKNFFECQRTHHHELSSTNIQHELAITGKKQPLIGDEQIMQPHF